MSSDPTSPAGSTGTAGERLPLIFAGIIFVEVCVIVALYWVGAHFR